MRNCTGDAKASEEEKGQDRQPGVKTGSQRAQGSSAAPVVQLLYLIEKINRALSCAGYLA